MSNKKEIKMEEQNITSIKTNGIYLNFNEPIVNEFTGKKILNIDFGIDEFLMQLRQNGKLTVNEAVEKILGGFEKASEPLTYKIIFVNNLLNVEKGETLTGAEKILKYELAKKIHNSKEDILLTIEEVKVLKTISEKITGVLISASCLKFLPA